QPLVQPLARRVQLEPVARIRRDERAPATVLLHAQLARLRARQGGDELLLVESEAEVVDARQLPLPRLDDHVDGAALQLGQAQLEAQLVQILPPVSRLERGDVLADPAVASNEVEAEL